MKYDIIDFHAFVKSYDSTIIKLLGNKIIKITIWGSDFIHATNERREEQRIILKECDCIQIVTKTMKYDFIEYFQDFEEKIRVANFGVYRYDIIDELKIKSFTPHYKTVNYRDKLLVICGYNGSKTQQHTKIIEAFDKLGNNIKDRIHLVFPMTYGSTKEYTNKIESNLKNTGISYLLLESYMNEEDVAKLRIETDMVVNVQITDAFSSSLQEHLYAGNLLLVGDWLPYSILDEHQVYYKRSSIDNLSCQINDCIVNFDKYNKLTVGNREKMHNISSWAIAGEKMSVIYKELLI